MKINGIDVKEHTDESLSKLQGVIKTAILLGYLFMIAVALWMVGDIAKTIVRDGMAYFAKHFFEWFFIPLLMKLVIFLFPCFIVAYLVRQKKGIAAELERRYPSKNDAAHISAMTNRAGRKFAIVIALLLALGAIGGLVLGLSITSKGKDGCRNCGRNVPLVAGFGYCADCHEGFVDWQKDNWTEKD